MDNPKDLWDILLVIGGFISGIFIPLSIFWVGHRYNKQLEVNSSKEREAERISKFLVHFSSENEQEKLLALSIADYLYQENQLPRELIKAIQTISSTDDSTAGIFATKLLTQQNRNDLGIFLNLFSTNMMLAKEFEREHKNTLVFKFLKSKAIQYQKTLELFIENADLIPSESKDYAKSIIDYLTDWLGTYKIFTQTIGTISLEDSIGPIEAPTKTYPQEAVDHFNQLSKTL